MTQARSSKGHLVKLLAALGAVSSLVLLGLFELIN